MVTLFLLIAFLFFPAVLSADPAPLEGFSDEELRRLERGEIVISVEQEENQPGRSIRAAFFVEQPVDRCWALLRLPERQHEFTSRLEESALMSESAGSKVVRFLLKVLLLKVRYQIIHIFNDEIYQVDIALDPGYENDMTLFDGRWRLYPVGEGLTLARYNSAFLFSPSIPAFVQRFLARQSIPSAMEAWKRWIDSGGTWRK